MASRTKNKKAIRQGDVNGPLVTARVVSKRSADKDAAQEIAASRKFRERLIVLRYVGIHRLGGIQGLSLCKQTVSPVWSPGVTAATATRWRSASTRS